MYRRGSGGLPDGEYARFTYDAFGRRTSARYDDSNDGYLDDEPADLYGYDEHWRLTTVARYEPAAVSPTLDERTYIRERFVYHASGSGESFSIGATGMDAPLARFIDDNGDGDYEDTDDRIDYYLTNRRGDVVAIMGPGTDTSSTPDGIADEPGELRARVRYSAFGVPTFVHPLDMDGDGLVGGTEEEAEDYIALDEALDNAGASRGWTNLGNVAQVTCITTPCSSDWPAWRAQQELHFFNNYPTSVIDLKSDFGNTPLYAGYLVRQAHLDRLALSAN